MKVALGKRNLNTFTTTELIDGHVQIVNHLSASAMGGFFIAKTKIYIDKTLRHKLEDLITWRLVVFEIFHLTL